MCPFRPRGPVRAQAGLSLVETILALTLLGVTLLSAAGLAVAARGSLARAAAAGRGQQTLSGAAAALAHLPADHPLWRAAPTLLEMPAPGPAVEATPAPFPGRPGLMSIDLKLRLRAGAGRDEVVRLWTCVRREPRP